MHRLRGTHWLALGLGLTLVMGCPPPPEELPPLSVEVGQARMAADGVGRTTVTARLGMPAEGAVVRFTSTGGLLSSSSAVVVAHEDGLETSYTASVELWADPEIALGRNASKNAVVRAFVDWTEEESDTAEATVVFEPSADGPPQLILDVAPLVAVAGSDTEVEMVAHVRRLEEGDTVAWTTTAGELSAAESTVEKDEEGLLVVRNTLTASAEPADAVVMATDPASGVSASELVRFVEEGAPQFDLNGTFAMFGPGRTKFDNVFLEPNPQCAVPEAVLMVDVTQEGLDLTANYRICSISLPDVNSVAGFLQTTAPQPFIDSFITVEHKVTLDHLNLGATYEPQESFFLNGVTMDDPATEELPTDPEDPRVYDADMDGNPGVTVENSLAGMANMTVRIRVIERAVVISSNRMQGDFDALVEAKVFGVWDEIVPDVVALPSVYQLVRVDGLNGSIDVDADGDGQITCTEIADVQDSLFDIAVPDTPLDCGEEATAE